MQIASVAFKPHKQGIGTLSIDIANIFNNLLRNTYPIEYLTNSEFESQCRMAAIQLSQSHDSLPAKMDALLKGNVEWSAQSNGSGMACRFSLKREATMLS